MYEKDYNSSNDVFVYQYVGNNIKNHMKKIHQLVVVH